jgi:dsRNA-specific ribonuclease
VQVIVRERVVAEAMGPSKKEAEQEAARLALAQLLAQGGG